MRIRAVIADDEPPALAKLRRMLAATGEVEILAEAADGAAAVQAIQALRPDVAFLDIRMPERDGIAAVKALQDPPQIVFVTAYSEHAVSAFEHQAVDYLLKPYTSARIQVVVERVRERLKLQRLAEWVRGEVQVAPAPVAGDRRLLLKVGSEIEIVAAADIECVMAEGNYLHVMTLQRKFFVRGVLTSFDEMVEGLPFLRVHRSATVNTGRIKSVSVAERELVTASGFRLPISRARMQLLLQTVEALGLPNLGARSGA